MNTKIFDLPGPRGCYAQCFYSWLESVLWLMPPALLMMRLRWLWSTSWARREGKKLSTEDVLILYLGTIAGDLKEIRTDIARLDHRIDETNKRIDEIVKTLSARIDETNKRIDAVQATLLEIQKLLLELVKTRQSTP